MDEILVRMMEHVREQGMKKRGEVVFEDNFKKILLILELKSISKRLSNEENGYKIGKQILERI